VGVSGTAVGLSVGFGVAVGVSVGLAVGVSVGLAVGVSVGLGVFVGTAVGVSGTTVGVSVGVSGTTVGVSVGVSGTTVGVSVGVSGAAVGVSDCAYTATGTIITSRPTQKRWATRGVVDVRSMPSSPFDESSDKEYVLFQVPKNTIWHKDLLTIVQNCKVSSVFTHTNCIFLHLISHNFHGEASLKNFEAVSKFRIYHITC